MNDFFNTWKIATEGDVKAHWGGYKPRFRADAITPDRTRFRCHFCGDNILVGGYYIILYTNDMPKAGGNPIICGKHGGVNGESLRNAWAEICAQYDQMRKKFWWAFDD